MGIALLPWLIIIYLLIGLLFSIPFIARGMQKIDPETKGSGFAFHVLMFPGAIAFWPLLLIKWVKA